MATYAMPALAGMMLVPIVIELGCKTALIVYAAAAILALLVTPDPEAAIMFLAFFGYYPTIKLSLDKIANRPLRWLYKFAIFNITVVGAYLIAIRLFGMDQLMDGFRDFGTYSAWILLGLGNLVFLLYDLAVQNLILLYVRRLRGRIFRNQ